MAEIYGVIQIKMNHFKKSSIMINDLPTKGRMLVTNISDVFTYTTAAKINWNRITSLSHYVYDDLA